MATRTLIIFAILQVTWSVPLDSGAGLGVETKSSVLGQIGGGGISSKSGIGAEISGGIKGGLGGGIESKFAGEIERGLLNGVGNGLKVGFKNGLGLKAEAGGGAFEFGTGGGFGGSASGKASGGVSGGAIMSGAAGGGSSVEVSRSSSSSSETHDRNGAGVKLGLDGGLKVNGGMSGSTGAGAGGIVEIGRQLGLDMNLNADRNLGLKGEVNLGGSGSMAKSNGNVEIGRQLGLLTDASSRVDAQDVGRNTEEVTSSKSRTSTEAGLNIDGVGKVNGIGGDVNGNINLETSGLSLRDTGITLGSNLNLGTIATLASAMTPKLSGHFKLGGLKIEGSSGEPNLNIGIGNEGSGSGGLNGNFKLGTSGVNNGESAATLGAGLDLGQLATLSAAFGAPKFNGKFDLGGLGVRGVSVGDVLNGNGEKEGSFGGGLNGNVKLGSSGGTGGDAEATLGAGLNLGQLATLAAAFGAPKFNGKFDLGGLGIRGVSVGDVLNGNGEKEGSFGGGLNGNVKLGSSGGTGGDAGATLGAGLNLGQLAKLAAAFGAPKFNGKFDLGGLGVRGLSVGDDLNGNGEKEGGFSGGLNGNVKLGSSGGTGGDAGATLGAGLNLGQLATLAAALEGARGSLVGNGGGIDGSGKSGFSVDIPYLPITSHLINRAAQIGSIPLHFLSGGLSSTANALSNTPSVGIAGSGLNVNVPSSRGHIDLGQSIQKIRAAISSNAEDDGSAGATGGKVGASASLGSGFGVSGSASLGSGSGVSGSASLGSGSGVSGSTSLGSGSGISGFASLGSGSGVSGPASLESGSGSASFAVNGGDASGIMKGGMGGLRVIKVGKLMGARGRADGGVGGGLEARGLHMRQGLKVNLGDRLNQDAEVNSSLKSNVQAATNVKT